MAERQIFVEFEPAEDGGPEWNVYVDADGNAYPDQIGAQQELDEQRKRQRPTR